MEYENDIKNKLDTKELCVIKSIMEEENISDNLAEIRSMMERSSVYSQPLSILFLFMGGAGSLSAFIGYCNFSVTPRGFAVYWMSVAITTALLALLIMTKQAKKSGEIFWGAPVRRLAHSLLPPCIAGALLGALFLQGSSEIGITTLVALWALFFGCALNSAAFVVYRKVRILSWAFIAAGSSTAAMSLCCSPSLQGLHIIMGIVFGCFFLLYGCYVRSADKN